MPRSARFLHLLFCTSLAFWFGCSSSRPVATPEGRAAGFPAHAVSEIHGLLELHRPDIASYTAETALSIRSPLRSGSFSASIRHKKNDSLLISISPGLGIEAVRALITRDSFFIHDRLNRELTVGALADLHRFLPLPATPEAIYAALLGLMTPDPTLPWSLSATASHYILKLPDRGITYTIDPTVWRVARYEERAADGTLVEERTFSDFALFDGIYLPRRMTFRRPGDQTAAALYYRKLRINPADFDLVFQVDESVARVSFP